MRGSERQVVAEALRDALDDGKEITENSEYDGAKQRQAFLEGRIRDLEILLATAVVVEETRKKGERSQVEVGCQVSISEDGGDVEDYQIVGSAEANPVYGKLSYQSPLGSALMHKSVGEEIDVASPDGDSIQ